MNREPTPGQVVRHYLDVFFAKDVEQTLQCLTDDVVWRVQGAPQVPTVGTRHGKDQVRAWMALFPAHFQPLAFQLEGLFENGDQVVVTGHLRHRILDTGREFASRFAAICTVREGKLSGYDFIEDSYALWQAFQPN